MKTIEDMKLELLSDNSNKFMQTLIDYDIKSKDKYGSNLLHYYTNMCRDFINAVVTVGVSYDASIDHVLDVLRDEMEQTKDIPDILETPVIVGVTGLDDSAVTVKIVAKCHVKTNISVEAELRRRIKNRLDKEGIEIPFPQRTLHIVQQKEG